MGNEDDARILALEQELAGSDTGSNDDKAAKRAAKVARKKAKVERKEAAAGSSDAAAAGSADAAAVAAPVTTARMFSVHAGETVHFSGRKPGDPKPKRGAKKRALEAACAAAGDAPALPPRWCCELCSIEVNSEDLLEEHREGWRHAEMVASKAARAAGLYCEVCSQGFTGKDQMEEHLNGGRHAAAVRGGGKGGKGKDGKDGKGGKGGKDGKGGKGDKGGKGGKGGKDGKGGKGKGDKGSKGGKGDKGGGKGGPVRQWS